MRLDAVLWRLAHHEPVLDEDLLWARRRINALWIKHRGDGAFSVAYVDGGSPCYFEGRDAILCINERLGALDGCL